MLQDLEAGSALEVSRQPSISFALRLLCFRAALLPSDFVLVITLYGPGGQHMLGAAGGGIPVRVRVSDADGECDSPAGRGAEFEALARHNHADC